ncbi:MAG: creatininase [Acidobacteria bacterium]|nr:MAG: creatininase [Acidobacteriota bacterium]PYU45870.1 MAG: creatininase [Acidobacteriota bacterium]PYU71018.1 MAG: creatininase [Acidobacteriota bacterium]
MAQITRRNILLAGLALPSIAEAVHANVSTAEGSEKPKRFEEVIGFEVAEAVSGHPIGILPLGSLEFHGPHNPLGTDSIIISGIAERVAARTRALLFPAVTFTQCPAHTSHFQGTISVRPEVMTLYFEDILRNILHLGFRKVFILNGHDGNIGPARGAVARIADEIQDAALLFANWWEFVSSETMKTMGLFHQSNGGHGHGGPLETSAIAAFRPDLIHLSHARDLPEPPELSGGAPYYLQKSKAAEWPGYSGNVSAASAEKGRKLVRISEDAIVKLIENWLSHDEVPGSW